MVMVLPTLPHVHPWVTMAIPTSSCSSCEVWSFSVISSRGLVRMRDPHRLRWGKERGPAGSFSSPDDQLGASQTKALGRRKTSQDVTRPSQNCNANSQLKRHGLLHLNHTNKYDLSDFSPRSPIVSVYVSFMTVWDFVSKLV